MTKDPNDMSVEELEQLLAQKKKDQEAKWEKERQDWRKKLTPEAQKYGFVIVEKGQATKPKGRRANLTEDDKKNMQQLRDNKVPVTQIAEEFGCSTVTVYATTTAPKN